MLRLRVKNVLGERFRHRLAAALRLLAGGLVDPTPLIAGRFPLRDGIAAFAAARGALKILVTP